jgi:hypothetical protein
VNTDQTGHEQSRALDDAMSEMAAELERRKNDPVPMCHFKPMAFDIGEEPCHGWYECRVCGHTEDSQEAWDKTWTLHYRRHARPSALVERYAARACLEGIGRGGRGKPQCGLLFRPQGSRAGQRVAALRQAEL